MQKHLVQPTNLPVLCWVRGGRGRGGGRGRRQHWLSSKELHLSHASAIPEQKICEHFCKHKPILNMYVSVGFDPVYHKFD